MRYLGIDYGSGKVGLALSDEAGTMGFPHGIIPNTPALRETLLTLIKKEGVGAIVMGDSRDFSGAPNPVAAGAQALGDALALETKLPVHYELEMFTSAEARRSQQIREPRSRAQKERGDVDASAAALILTSFLSHHHG